jgi:hypothetical protein
MLQHCRVRLTSCIHLLNKPPVATFPRLPASICLMPRPSNSCHGQLHGNSREPNLWCWPVFTHTKAVSTPLSAPLPPPYVPLGLGLKVHAQPECASPVTISYTPLWAPNHRNRYLTPAPWSSTDIHDLTAASAFIVLGRRFPLGEASLALPVM